MQNPRSASAFAAVAIGFVTLALFGCEPAAKTEVPDAVAPGTQAPVAEVLTRAREAVLQEPNSFERWLELATLLDAHDQYDPAIICYERCLEIDSQHRPARYHYGVCLELVGRPEEAKAAFETVATANPDYAPVLFRLGELYYREGNNEVAKQRFEQHLALQDTLYGRVRLGQILVAQGDPHAAIPHLESVRDALPRSRTVLAALAQAYARAGRSEESVATNALLVSGDLDDAGLSLPDPLRYAVSTKAVDSISCVKRAEAHEAKGQFQDAIRELEAAARGRPDSAPIRDRIGRAYIRIRQYETSIEHFDRALGLDFGYANSYHNRALAKLALGRKDQAIQDFRRALKLDPNHELALQQLQKLGIEP